MPISVLRYRPDHIAELTKGVGLPLERISRLHMQIVAETVSRTWIELRAAHSQMISVGTEAEINALLEAKLNALYGNDQIWSQLVTTVARGKETLSYSGLHLEKRPDLSIFLTKRHPSFPIVIECKIVDKNDSKSVDLYCKNGIARFVKGEYAWANREAMLFAFVRDGTTIDGHLSPHLDSASKQSVDPWKTLCLPRQLPGMSSDARASSHARSFSYQAPNDNATPGAIELWHLWLHTEIVNT